MRKLPWIAAYDRLNKPHGYDCSECLRREGRKSRTHMKCGWIPREQWHTPKHSVWGVIGDSTDIPETCPGYTTRLPQVQEVARLWGWEKRGSLRVQLRSRGIEPTPLQLDLLDVFAGEWAHAESWEMTERGKSSGGK